MKFKFWKNKKDETPVPEETGPKTTINRADISTTFDYDKIAHNQFLTPDKKYGEYMEEQSIDPTKIDAHGNLKTNYKQENMMSDEMAFNTINQTINLSLGQNQQEFKLLYNRAENISEEHKIPVKKKFFGKKEAHNFNSISATNPVDVYNIQEDQTKKYDSRVNYNALMNEQTKLLDLSSIEEDGVGSENTEEISQPFSVNTSNGNLTNRLFQDAVVDVPVHASIPRKTINLANEDPIIDRNEINEKTKAFNLQEDQIVAPVQPEPVEEKVVTNSFIIKSKQLADEQNTLFKNTTRPYNNSINLADALTNNSGAKSIGITDYEETHQIINNQPKKPIATTALRYLTPVEDDEFQENRIKKENRRFIKPRG